MGRNLSPVVRRELANLDKDAESRKLAMKALKLYVKDLDSKAIPHFLAQVSETKDPSSSSVEHTISLYEVLARVHGPNIIPQIDSIMSTIIKTLTSSAGSFPLQQACSKVVPAIARYGMDPSTPEDKKRHIILSLCKPLSDSLLGSQESLAFGAALCLKALVDSDNWRFASDEIVNEVCLRVAGALEEKPTQTNSHMGLAMALAKHNGLIVEAYARSLVRSGLRILNVGVAEGNSQKRFSAIQMVNFLMKCLDPRSIISELGIVIEELEKCHSDQMAFVRGAAFEALQTARMLAAEEMPRLEKDRSPITGSNFGRRRFCNRNKNSRSPRDRSPILTSPESQTVDSFVEYDYLAESPMSTGQVSCNLDYSGRVVNRKLWKNENGGVDVSLKDGFYSGSNGSNPYLEHIKDDEISENGGDHSEVFSGFVHTIGNGVDRSATSSPQRRHSQLNIDGINIFTTPRKLIHSLQDPNNVNSDFSEKQTRRIRSTTPNQLEWSPRRKFERNGSPNPNYEVNDNDNENSSEFGEEHVLDGSESVSSTGDVAVEAKPEVSREVNPLNKSKTQSLEPQRRSLGKTWVSLICGVFFIFLAVILSVMWIDNQNEGSDFTPT